MGILYQEIWSLYCDVAQMIFVNSSCYFLRSDTIKNLSQRPATWWRHQIETFSALLATWHKGQWRGALVFPLICVWINGWVNNREAGDLRRPLWRHSNDRLETEALFWYKGRLSKCGDFHYENKTAVRTSYLSNGNHYTGKTTSLYWNTRQWIRWDSIVSDNGLAPNWHQAII